MEVRLLTSAAAAEHLGQVWALLDEAFGADFSEDDWAHCLGGTDVVLLDGAMVVTHAAVMSRTLEVGGRPLRTGYVEGVATRRGREGAGFATLVMTEVDALIRDRFELGALSTERHGFYERLGWERWRGPTAVRSPSGLIRTEEEDDGVLVLRFGPSAALDLRAPITCAARPGDAW
ncbi:MAG: GNAT family N-acetyltransferase [Actinomycetota bacterium]|nr:GNAT family N-acetyltransferase [Actinomycetota bacterium]